MTGDTLLFAVLVTALSGLAFGIVSALRSAGLESELSASGGRRASSYPCLPA